MADDPRKTAFDESAPQQERYDAQAELAQAHKPLSSQLIPADDLRQIFDYINDNIEDQQQFGKAQIIPFPNENRQKRRGGMQSIYLDDLQIYAHGEYYEKPSPIGFDSLRAMVEQTPVLNAVIMTRIRQISAFTRPQEQDRGEGFVIRHVEKDHQCTKDEEQSMQLLSRFVTNCGWEFNPRARKRLKRDNFSQFCAKLIRDSLTMDSAPIETELKRDRRQGIDGFYAVDGSTIRLCTEEGYEGNDEIFALQVVQGRIRTAYSHDDLIYEARNPRTDVRLAGYGLGETELLIRIVTGFLNALTHNIKGFDDNSIPKGLLHLSGSYDSNDLTAFRRYWNSMVKGINNAWTLPVMVSQDQESRASFERFGVDFDEMYFSKWMTFLTSIICAIYGMSPDEINFESFSAQRSSLSGSDTAEKLASSKDKGLRPLMSYIESLLSDFIICDFSDKYVFRWAGLDEEDEEKHHEMRKLVLTVNEIRAQEGYDKAKDGWGDAPVNPSLLGAWQQEQQANQSEDFGQPPEEDGQQQGQPAEAAENGEQEEGDYGDRQGDFGKTFPPIYGIE